MQKKTSGSAALHQIPLTAKQKSSSTNNGDVDKEDLLKALLALKNGDFSFRLAGSKTGIAGKIYNTINEIADLNSKTITDFKKAEDVTGKGDLSKKIIIDVKEEILELNDTIFKKSRQLSVQEQNLKQINYYLENEVKERRKIEDELRLRNMQLSEAQKLTHLGSWEWNVLTDKMKGSDEIFDIYDIKSSSDLTMENLFEKIHPADIEKVRETLANSISMGNSFDIQFRYISAGKQIKYINKKGRVIKNEENEVITMIGTSQDITALKKTEEQLKIFNLFEKMLNEIYIFSERNFKVLYANVEALRNLGHTANLINNYTLFDILTDFKRTSFKKTIAPLLNGIKDKIITFGSFKGKMEAFILSSLIFS